MIDNDPGNLDAFQNMGNIYLLNNNADNAIEWYNKILSKNPNYLDAVSARALAYIVKENYEKAIDDYLILVDNDNMDGLNGLKTIADSAALKDMVIDKLKAKQAANPTKSSYLVSLGSIYSDFDDHKAALDVLKKAYNLDQIASYAYYVSGAYSNLGQDDKAEEWIKIAENKARENSENLQDYLVFHGNILENQGKTEEAMKYYNHAIDSNMDNPAPLWNRGYLYMELGNYQKALDDLNAYCEKMDKPEGKILCIRGWLNEQLGHEMEAQGLYKQAIEADSVGTPTMATYLSQHFLHLDKQASDNVLKCLNDNPSMSELFYAACYYALVGDKPMAMRQLELANKKGGSSYYMYKVSPWLKPMHGYKEFDDMINTHI